MFGEVQMAAVTLGCGADGCDGAGAPRGLCLSHGHGLLHTCHSQSMQAFDRASVVQVHVFAEAMLAHTGLFFLNDGCGYVLILVVQLLVGNVKMIMSYSSSIWVHVEM